MVTMKLTTEQVHDSKVPFGLDQLGCQITAEIVGLVPSMNQEDRGVALRLLEIGFLPGESVRVIAHGFPAHDPLAVRVGHTTFALRSHEAALVQVRVNGDRKFVNL
jgi:ferrous iron transport protein A